MTDLERAAIRDGRGRFLPGRSGNPAGKKPGTLNQATVLRAALRDGEEQTAARAVIDKAVRGNLAAARILFDRTDPKPRGRAIPLLQLEPGAAYDPARALAVLDSAFEAMALGEISPEEALMVARALKAQRQERAAAEAAAQAIAARPAAAAPQPAAAPVVAPVTSRRPAAAGEAPTLHSPCISGQPVAPKRRPVVAPDSPAFIQMNAGRPAAAAQGFSG